MFSLFLMPYVLEYIIYCSAPGDLDYSAPGQTYIKYNSER